MTAPAHLHSLLPAAAVPKVIRAREYGQVCLLPSASFTVADRVALEELNTRLKREAFRIRDTAGGPILRASQFVGVFTLPSFTLHVEPKSETPAKNLLFMLLRSQTAKVSLPHAWQGAERIGQFPEVLAQFFLKLLREELGRGLLRQSQVVQEESTRLRGRLRVAEYLRRRDPTRLPVQYPDLTANHPVNQVFATALHRVLRLAASGRLRGEAAELLAWLTDAGVSPLSAVSSRRDRFRLNRLQERYRPALDLAWLILDGLTMLPVPGQVRAEAFTFDMDKVFERFLERLIAEDVLGGTGLRGLAQGKTPYGGAEHLFGTAQHLKPDLVVWKGHQARLIIDFKNKRPDGQVSREDLYQMYAYARHLECSRVLLLYPGAVTVPPLQTTKEPFVQVISAGVDLSGDLNTPAGYRALVGQLRAVLSEQGVFE